MSCTDILQTVATWGLLIIAIIALCYAYTEYKNIKNQRRPYISVLEVTVDSNLTERYPIFHPEKKKDVPPKELLNASKEIHDQVEEILITLHIKNTGPVAGKDVNIEWA